MAEPREKVALIVNTASYERVAFALNMALAAAALGRDVYVLFGYSGVIRLKRSFTDRVGEETNGWIEEQIKSAVDKGGVHRISQLLTDLRKLGGKVYACPAAMALHNLIREDLINEVDEVRGTVEFLMQDAKEASIIYV